MKHVVSISLGSSSRDNKITFQWGDQTILLERIGCDGDEKKACALFTDMDGKVDAFGVGGVELYVRVKNKSYPLQSGLGMVKNVKKTPYTDGRGLKLVLEQNVWQMAEPRLKQPITPRKAMMPLAIDRYGMAHSLDRAGFDIVYCDLMFGLGIPIPVHKLSHLRLLARLLLPILGRVPISMLYPTGHSQDENIPKYDKWFKYGPVIAGDFLYIRRYMPHDLSGKVIVSNTTTQSDVNLVQARGASYLITSTPRLEGRSFGTNMFEAALIAYAGKGRELTDDELAALVKELDLKPDVQELN